MTMKPVLTAFLALCLLLSLTACASLALPSTVVEPETKAQETKAPETEAPAPETEAPTEAPAPETEAPTEAPAPETEAPTEAPTEEPAVGLTHGTVEGNSYTNETLNIRFTLPKGWVFYTEEQIAAQNNITVDMFQGTDVAEALQTNGQLIDMVASTSDGSNTNLVIQPAQELLSFYTDKQLFELMRETITTQFESAGMELKEYEILDVPALGKDQAALRMVVTMSGIEMTQYQIWLRENPDYLGVLTVTSMTELDAESLFDGLSRLHD